MAEQDRKSANEIQIFYYDELNFTKNYKKDTSDVKLPSKLENKQIVENSDGTWSESTIVKNKPYESINEITNNTINERNALIENYENLITPFDKELYNYNEQINQKKIEISNLVSQAVSFGCSTLSPVVGSALTPGSENIGGVSCGIGSTILSDQALIGIYPNLSKYDSENPFDPDSDENLSPSNYGKGYESFTKNNSGNSISSLYKYISPISLNHPISIANSCVGISSSIINLANEIVTLRQLRDQNIEKINILKNDKNGEEVRRWGTKQSEFQVNSRKRKLNSLISNISNYSDPVVFDSLLLWIDSSKDYSIEYDLANEFGISDITRIKNIVEEVNTFDIEISPLYEESDSQSMSFNRYEKSGQHIPIGKNYINDGIDFTNSSYSLEVWIKLLDDSQLGPSETSGSANIVGVDDSNGYGMQLYKPNSTKLSFGNRITGSLISTSSIDKNTWYHIICTREHNVGNKIYINSELDSESDSTSLNLTFSSNEVRIGTNENYILQDFIGKIGLVRIYGKSLSLDEVKKNYAAGSGRFS
jgi:hypothetical protein